MIVAIPMVTRYIDQARQDTFVDTAKSYIATVRYAYLNNELSCSGTAGKWYVSVDASKLEKGGASPWGNKAITSYVTIDVTAATTTSDQVTVYSYLGTDGTHGIKTLTAENALKRSSVSTSSAGTAAVPTGYTNCTYQASTS